MNKNHNSKELEKKDMILTDSSFFIMINDPNNARRSVLEASKSALVAIKGIYEINNIKVKKQERLELLRSQVREIRLLLQKAEELMPKYSKMEANKRFPHLFEEQKHEPKKNVAKHRPVITHGASKALPVDIQKKLTEAEKIAQSMQMVQEKLNSLPEKKQERRVISEKKQELEQPKIDVTRQTEKESDPRLTMEDMNFTLGKTLENIQKKLKDL